MERVSLVITYHPALPNITAILDKYQPILNQSELMRKAALIPLFSISASHLIYISYLLQPN